VGWSSEVIWDGSTFSPSPKNTLGIAKKISEKITNVYEPKSFCICNILENNFGCTDLIYEGRYWPLNKIVPRKI
jgi:hypothetical protein